MGKTMDEMIKAMPKDRQKRIAARAAELEAEYLTLQSLRKALGVTQVNMADALGVKQASIAKLEQRSDMLISTLRRNIEAMGGQLNLSVEFPGGAPVHLTGLGDVDGKT